MKKIKFLRRNTEKYSRLGRGRKKLQKWRSPKGRDNKMRLRRKGYSRTVEIGYKQSDEARKKQVIIRNAADLKKAEKNQEFVIGKVGMRKRKELIEKAKEKGIRIVNEKKKETKKIDGERK